MTVPTPEIDISAPGDRLRAKAELFLKDHGFLRVFWTHLHQIAPGAWRSNQPGARRLAAYRQMGIRSVLRLRVANGPLYLLEREACEQLGLTLHNAQINAGTLVSRESYLDLLDTFRVIERPFVMHCKSGIDRTGLAAFLYLLAETETSPEIAREQLSFKYLHLNGARHGILDHMADRYLAAWRADGIGIRDWIRTVYDRDEMVAEYRKSRKRT